MPGWADGIAWNTIGLTVSAKLLVGVLDCFARTMVYSSYYGGP